MMKLSKTQAEIVRLMSDGWALCASSGMSSSVWLQEGGCGRGGKSRRVSITTLNALRKAGVIVEKKREFPTTTYILVSPN